MWVPPRPAGATSAGSEMVELARQAGLDADPWQELVIDHSSVETVDPETERVQWQCMEVGLEVSRQNGKGGALEIRSLGGLFLLGEEKIVWSAHEFKTAMEAFKRVEELIAGQPDLARRVRKVKRAHGEEGIYLKTGQAIEFRTRTLSGARGLGGDTLFYDEAMILREFTHGSMMPILSARPNPQIFYAGSPVDKDQHEHGIVFSRVRARALAENDMSLAWFGWRAPVVDIDQAMTADIATDPTMWAAANPAMGTRITAEYIAKEQRSLSPRVFAVERMGVGDWWDPEETVEHALDYETWKLRGDKLSVASDPVCFAFDVKPDRSASAICVAGRNQHGRLHTEVVRHAPGTNWVVPELKRLLAEHAVIAGKDVKPVKCADRSQAASLVAAAAVAGIEVERVSTSRQAEACGLIHDTVKDDEIRHLGNQEPLNAAVQGAARRDVGDGAHIWSRKSSTGDITPLMACTLATWGLASHIPAQKPTAVLI